MHSSLRRHLAATTALSIAARLSGSTAQAVEISRFARRGRGLAPFFRSTALRTGFRAAAVAGLLAWPGLAFAQEGGKGGAGVFSTGGNGGNAGQAGSGSICNGTPDPSCQATGGAAGTTDDRNGSDGGQTSDGGGGGGGGADGGLGGVGGNGGNGASPTGFGSDSVGGGGGGAGGNGSFFGFSIAIGTVGEFRGGNGGNGGNASPGLGNNNAADGGGGGDGGNGFVFTKPSTLTLGASASITGGNGGLGGAGSSGTLAQTGFAGANGRGGAGVIGGDLIISTAGTITGGLGGDGITRANAITFTGGSNRLTFTGTESGLSGNIDVTGTLEFNQPTDITVDDDITGIGSISKTGAGSLTLTGTNSYAGTTTISAGALRIGDGGTSGTLGAGDVTNNASLIFNRSDEITVANLISGSGGLTQAGTGTTTLAAVNTYSGGTTLGGGTLQVTAAAANPLGTGDITFNGGDLRFANDGSIANKLVFASTSSRISTAAGTTLKLEGSAGIDPGSTLRFGSAADTGTIIWKPNGVGVSGAFSLAVDGGELRNANGHVSFLVNLATQTEIASGATLNLNGFASTIRNLQGSGLLLNDGVTTTVVGGNFSGAINGTQSLITTGNVTLSGANSYTGTTTVSAGTLEVDGSVIGRTTVRSGATLTGKGTLGATTIDPDGIHAVEDGQTVKGDYVNRGRLAITATPDGAETLFVNGTVDITDATLDLTLSPDTLTSWDVFNGPFVLIQNDDSDDVIGDFANITRNLIFLDPTVSTAGGDGNDVTLQLTRNQIGFADVGQTRNQAETGNAVETLTNSSAVWRALASSASAEEARALLDQLSGEVHASLAGMLTQDSRFWRNAANDRLRAAVNGVAASGEQVMGLAATGFANAPADTRGPALWTRGFGAWARTGSDGNASDFTRNAGGFLAGADMALADAVRLGALAGYARSSFEDDRKSSGDADSYQIGLYGGTQMDAVGLRAGIAYALHAVETRRQALGDKLAADYDAGTLQVFGEAGYTFDLAALRLEPFANAAYVSTRTDAFKEEGGPAALASEAETNDNSFTTLGLRAAVGLDLAGMPASLRAMAGWRHAFGDVRPEAVLAFQGAEDFVVAGAPVARDAAVLEAGFELSISADATLGLAYSGEIGDDAEDHSLNATLAVELN